MPTINLPKNPIIEDRFSYHTPSEAQSKRIKKLREAAKELAYVIDEECPPGPDRTAAMRKLEEAASTAIKSVVAAVGYR